MGILGYWGGDGEKCRKNKISEWLADVSKNVPTSITTHFHLSKSSPLPYRKNRKLCIFLLFFAICQSRESTPFRGLLISQPISGHSCLFASFLPIPGLLGCPFFLFFQEVSKISFLPRIGSPTELRTRNYRGFARNFDPNPMGPVLDPKT